MSFSFSSPIPIFRIFDQVKATEFYIQWLGFTMDWSDQSEGPLYQQISLKGFALHLSEHHGDGTPGAHVRVKVNGLGLFHQELSRKQYIFMKPGLETTDRKTLEMSVIDPFGNTITFWEDVEKDDS